MADKKKLKKIMVNTEEENKNDIEITEGDIDVECNEERPGVGYEIFGSSTDGDD